MFPENYLRGTSFLLHLQAEILLKTIVSKIFPRVYGIVENLIVETFLYFFIIIYVLLISLYVCKF